MVKVLIANREIEKEIKNFHFLKERSNEFEIITSCSGAETVEKCKEVEPSIIILNSDFSDMLYTDVLNSLSNLPSENDKCNLILTVENPQDKMLLSNTSIIYKILNAPLNETEMRETIELLKTRFELPNLTLKGLRSILLSLGINIYSIGAQYLISAIFKSYYHSKNFITLDHLYSLISEDYNVSKEQVKNSIRHCIDTFNKGYNISDKDLYFKIFGRATNISSKQFIQLLIDYLQK